MRFFCVVGTTMLALLLGFAMVLLIREDVLAFYVRQFGKPAAEFLMPLSAMLPSMIILFSGLWIVERWAKRDARITCPHCGKLLVGMRYLVVATRNCGYCGRRVLGEPIGPT
jgi:hypothetical protein